MKKLPVWLSKTKLMRGYRCAKYIYLTIHHPEYESPITPEMQALFEQGNKVGEVARQFFPGGVLVDNLPWDFSGAIAKTRALIANNTPLIYEAAFEYMGFYARADILQFNPLTKRWKIFEVKSSTKVKPEHIDDVGLQTWVMAKSGLPIEQIHLLHLNSACRFPDLTNLFISQDITDELRQQYLSIQPKLFEILTTLRGPTIPDVNIGAHCTTPNECTFKAHCWREKQIPDFSLFDLPNIYKKQWEYYQQGLININDERLQELSELQQRVIHTHQTGERYVDKEGIKTALADWQFPLIFLDFETINPAIPMYEASGPFQHVPFQFSAHIWPAPEAEITHQAFLHTEADDPRPGLIPALLNACGEKGTIVAYFSKFECERILELANHSLEHKNALEALIPRFADPLTIIREHVYDKNFAGRFSLKKVGPALLGDLFSYEAMDVGNGLEAQRAFLELINKKNIEEKNRLKQALLDYCEKDTLVMVELVKWLYAQNA